MMTRYSHSGSDVLESKISRDLQRIVGALLEMPEGKFWKSIVLMGGYGRKEGTTLVRGDEEFPFNDYDLIVVADNTSFFRRRMLQAKLNAVSEKLSVKLQFPVEIYLHTFDSLTNSEASLMNYEIKHGHHCLYGEEDHIELLMPHFETSDIPLAEGTRLLLNRGTLLFYFQNHLLEKNTFTTEDIERFYKFINKAHLAMGDCLLMMANRYHLSYQIKKKTIQEVAGPEYEHNILVDWVREKYLKSIAFKEKASFQNIDQTALMGAYHETVPRFISFYKWFEQRRLNKAFTTMSEHADAILHSAEPRGVKQLALNLWLLGKNSARPLPLWSCIHPRNRLFVALPALLEDKLDESSSYLSLILGCNENRHDLTEKFIQLRKRLS